MSLEVFRGQRVWPILVLTLAGAAPGAARPATPTPVVANDNRRPAGVERDGVLTLALTARRGAWAPEGPHGPSVTIDAFGEVGRPLQVPAPLLRVVEGTTIDATVTNELETTLQVFGLCARGGAACETLTVPPGEARKVRFASGPAGTYHYWATAIGAPVPFRELAGAFIVDPAGVPAPADRVFVITEWSGLSTADLVAIVTADEPGEAFIARQPALAFMINGRSWPATERLHARVGVVERWRIVNLSSQLHPMHLHGFFFDVESRGDGRRDVRFEGASRPHVVTEVVPPAGTMVMTWTPARPGQWLFHCHVMQHVSPLHRVRGAGEAVDAHRHPAGHDGHGGSDTSLGMSGLVLGIVVSGPPAEGSAPTAADPGTGLVRRLTMAIHSQSWHGEPADTNGVAFTEAGVPPSIPTSPGPPLVLTRGQPVEITIENHMREGTAIHWHGIELDSVYDGVHGWSGTGDQRAPMIPAGGQFVVRFTPPRVGTFIYHTHLHDHVQLSSGLYGALPVVEPDGYDADTDHALVLGRAGLDSGRLRVTDATTPLVLNGATAPRFVWAAGRTHRLRLVNITADDALVVTLRDAKGPVAWRPVAKDGAALPSEAQVRGVARQSLSVGETVDVEFEAPPGRTGLWLDVTTAAGQWELQARLILK